MSLVMWDAHSLLHDLRVSVRMTDPVLGNMNEAAQHLNEMAKTSQVALVAETKRLNASTLELQKTEASARLLILRTNQSVNGYNGIPGLLPQATAAFQSANALTDKASSDLDGLMVQLQPSLANLNRGTQGLADTANDPQLHETLTQLSSASLEAAGTLGEAHKAVEDVRQMADKARADFLKPVSVWWQLVKTLLPLAGSAAQVVK